MNFKRKIKIKDKYIKPIFLLFFIIIIVLLFAYGNIINKNVKRKKFANENMKLYEENKDQVFKVEKILICSSANAVDFSEKQNLQDMSIYQYTDIAVYINNGDELTNKNTVKKLYIDNVSLEGTSDIGKKSLNYKNILKFGLKKDNKTKSNAGENSTTSGQDVFAGLLSNTSSSNNAIDVGSINTNEEDDMISLTNNTSSENAINDTSKQEENSSVSSEDGEESQAEQKDEKIDFNIVYTNEENEKANYDDPTFYTDCSNPITLEYLNNDIVTHYKMDENKSVSFDGSILKEVGVGTESLNCKVKFKINIINNNDEKYSCWINFSIPLDDIYEGTTMKAKTTNSQKYVFFRE